ncbi:UNVERIFIED_CONTAM: U-box domain-containing protein 40 [Sesamum angustifolium]|uniref:U-box domain-containing protein 40 n=1 Tax=Sesamum angustifolium TaxID=2727405 RepID=A0AAW2RN86_9LAMI
MIKLGSIQILLSMVKSSHMPGRALLVLCNLAASVEGRAAMLDGGAVECLVGFLSRGNFDSEATLESCLAAIYGLSYGGLRFKGLAKEAGAEEVLMGEERGSHRAKEKVKRILEVLRHKDEEEEEIDWEELLNSEDDWGGAGARIGVECNKC